LGGKKGIFVEIIFGDKSLEIMDGNDIENEGIGLARGD
jgi:hypothetical protein